MEAAIFLRIVVQRDVVAINPALANARNNLEQVKRELSQ